MQRSRQSKHPSTDDRDLAFWHRHSVVDVAGEEPILAYLEARTWLRLTRQVASAESDA